MGVKDLWNILSPLCEKKPLFTLQGKTVAIDLSCWIVDSQTIGGTSAQPKMYLRNLYFRTAFLLMQDITPVFVLEGKAPTLKHNTIAKRNNNRNQFRERKTTRKAGRSQFNRILNECRQMLEYIGLTCVQGHGEAEAMCAYLNEDGLVDGCISQDSDCFLYGAKVVYRNFCTSAMGNQGGTGGSIDEYSMRKIEETLSLGRNKMIALALLCGCDYDDGLNGVGKEAAMKLFNIVEDKDILERIKSWKVDNSLDEKETVLLCPNTCSSCGHSGKVQKHTKSGCIDCGTFTKCNDDYKEKRVLMLNEIALRKKSLLVENFPNQELIDEFLIRKDPVPTKLDLQWKRPQVEKFIDFMERHLSWEPQYIFEKIFPLTTRWQLLHLPDISIEKRLSMLDLFIPETIKKIRNIRSIASYEIIWKSEHNIIEKLKEYMDSDKENDGIDKPQELISIEPQCTVLACYPELVEEFESKRNAKVKKRPAKSRAAKTGNKNTENVENAKAPGQKRDRKKVVNTKNNRKLDEFITTNRPLTLEESFEKMSITPKRPKRQNVPNLNVPETSKQCQNSEKNSVQLKRGPQFDKVLQTEKTHVKLNNSLDRMFNELSPDDFVSDNDDHDLDMTEIIEKICSDRIFKCNIEKNVEALVMEDNANTECIYTDVNRRASTPENNTMCNESIDEFANINEDYVPLSERILNGKKSKSLAKLFTKGTERFSFGLDDLMNDTDPNGITEFQA